MAVSDDKNVMLAAVTRHGFMLHFASKALRSDKEMVLAAVANHGTALMYASRALRSDKEVVLAAVTQRAFALQYASEALRADKEVVLATVTNNGGALTYATAALQTDPLMLRLAEMTSRAKRRWHVLKRWWLMRNLMAWLIGEWAKAEYAAHFDAAGEVVLVGGCARAAKRDWATMMA